MSAIPPLLIDYGNRGRGVFAGTEFPKGAIVEICPIIEIPSTDVGASLWDHVFSSPHEGRVLVICGFGMLYNHSADANVDYCVFDESRVAFLSTRDVAAGEELTINYGHNWWTSRFQRPIDEAL